MSTSTELATALPVSEDRRQQLAKRHKQIARLRKLIGATILYLVLLAGSVVFMVPFIWMLSTSLKSRSEVLLLPIRWVPEQMLWSNYAKALFGVVPFLLFFKNSLIIVAFDLIGDVLVCALVGYAFARLRAPGKNILFLIVLSTLMLPEQVLLVPTYVLYKNLGWLDTLYGLIVPNLLASGAFFIFLFRQFIQTIHRELDDAAKIDGCGLLAIFWWIILPLTRPALVTVGILSFLSHWNSFLWPLILLKSEENYTVMIGLRYFQSYNTESSNLPQLMAASLVALLPCLIIFFVAQRSLVQGVVTTGVKG